MEYSVENFKYNGFMVTSLKGNAKYTAKFLNWTSDPGIIKCSCSDGVDRLIPSCCIIGFKSSDYPKQEKTGVIFGQPSKS